MSADTASKTTDTRDDGTVYCHACSVAGNADMPVYHEPPVCGQRQPPPEPTPPAQEWHDFELVEVICGILKKHHYYGMAAELRRIIADGASGKAPAQAQGLSPAQLDELRDLFAKWAGESGDDAFGEGRTFGLKTAAAQLAIIRQRGFDFFLAYTRSIDTTREMPADASAPAPQAGTPQSHDPRCLAGSRSPEPCGCDELSRRGVQPPGATPAAEPECTCPTDRHGVLDVLADCPEHGIRALIAQRDAIARGNRRLAAALRMARTYVTDAITDLEVDCDGVELAGAREDLARIDDALAADAGGEGK